MYNNPRDIVVGKIWVPGYSDVPVNEEADRLARFSAQETPIVVGISKSFLFHGGLGHAIVSLPLGCRSRLETGQETHK